MEISQLRFKNSKGFILFVCFVCFSFLSQGQTNEILTAYKAKYPGNHIVQTKNERTVTIKYVKGKPTLVYHYVYEDLIIDKNGANMLSEYAIDFTSFETVSNIEAYSLIPSESKSKKVVSNNMFTRDAEADRGIFHDDSKETVIVFPGLIEGALRHISYDITMTENDFPFGFIFFDYTPTENPTFKIVSDTSIHLLLKEYNTDKIKLKKEETISKNIRTTTYSCDNALLLKPEDNSPNIRYYAPQILAQIAYYNYKGEKVNVGANLKDLHTNYAPNVAEVENEKPSPEITRIADSITRNLSTNLDKVRAIYYWVQDHVKYIAFEEGMGGFVPRQPNAVVDKRFGDCKDMASLIYSMLKAVNIPSYLTWVGSRDLPFKYSEFPSGMCDNHMITTYKEDGKYYFLDATNSFQTMNASTGFIQGKEALLHLSPTEYELTSIPVRDENYSTVYDFSSIKIEGKDLVGKSHTTIDGYYHTLIGNYAKDVLAKDLNKFLTSINQRGNNSFIVTGGTMQNVLNRDTTGVINFDWTCKNYCTNLDDAIYINMILNKNITYQNELKETRIAPFELDHQSADKYVVELEIPQNYVVSHLPASASFHSDIVDFDVKYEQKGSKIIMTLDIALKFLILEPSQFAEWNKFVAQKKKAISETIELKRKK
ncbi:Transglutaminase-like superfamily protein [compost metagenome]